MEKRIKKLGSSARGTKVIQLPGEFSWLEELDPNEQASFISGLLARVPVAIRSNDWARVSEWVEEWKATANIFEDSQVVRDVKAGFKELRTTNAIDWPTLRAELGL